MFLYLTALVLFRTHVANNTNYYETEIECELNGNTYGYSLVFDDNFRVHELGGDAYIAVHIDIDQCDDANVIIAHIEDYFEDKGGSCTIIKDREQIDKNQ